MPGTKITEEDRKKIDAKFICTVCDLLLCYPIQTACGHLMCFSCLQALLGGPNSKCPGDGTELKRSEVFPDAFTKRELKGLHLHCTNPGCPWHGAYEDLEGHSGACEHALFNCVHSQCKTKLQRSHLGKHLENECEYRNVKCEYCGSDVAFASIKDHVATGCQAAPVKCRYCKADVLRKDIKEHERLSCDEIPAACDFQAVGCSHNKVLKRKELRQHLNDGLIYHVKLLLHFVLNFFSQLKDYIPRAEFSGMMHMLREEVSEVRVGLTEKFVTLIGKITGLERRIEGIESTGGVDSRIKTEVQALKAKMTELTTELSNSRERNVHLERELREKTSEMERLRGRLDQVDESLALNTVKITDLESAPRGPPPDMVRNGMLLWKIDDFERKRHEAISGVKTFLCSPPFYSSEFGYKMCAKIFLDGDGFGKGSYLSLFFVVMKDENDALQPWPFQMEVTMMLMDQGNGRDNKIDSFHSDPQQPAFQQPETDMNTAYGFPEFMTFESLNNRAYIVDNVMFVKVIVNRIPDLGNSTPEIR